MKFEYLIIYLDFVELLEIISVHQKQKEKNQCLEMF